MVVCANGQTGFDANKLPVLKDNSGNCQLIGDGIEVVFYEPTATEVVYNLELEPVSLSAKVKALKKGATHVKFDKEECEFKTIGYKDGKECTVIWKAYKCK